MMFCGTLLRPPSLQYLSLPYLVTLQDFFTEKLLPQSYLLDQINFDCGYMIWNISSSCSSSSSSSSSSSIVEFNVPLDVISETGGIWTHRG